MTQAQRRDRAVDVRPLLESERDWLLADLRDKRGVVVCCDTLWQFLKRCGNTFRVFLA